MSRIGLKPIILPEGVTATVENDRVMVKGKKGELYTDFNPNKVKVTLNESKIKVELLSGGDRAYWGLIRSLINNNVIGVSQGFTKKLLIEGVGYRASVQGNKLVLNLGYSNPVEMNIPEQIKVEVKDNMITVSGNDKYYVGQFAVLIREKRVPDAYKGKGVRYENERIKLKVGKTGV